MKSRPGVAARALCSILCLFLLPRLPGAAAGAPPAPAPAPKALVKRIVVGDGKETAADFGRARLTRAGAATAVPLSTGLALYVGDTVETLADTRVTLLFLDAPVNEKDNEVIVNADTKITISSTYSWWGSIWVKVRGAFESRTRYARLGAQGTEYEVRVVKGSERPTLLVLEGGVRVNEGTFTAQGRAGVGAQAGAQAEVARGWRPVPAAFASYAPEPAAQVQYGRAIDVPAGQLNRFEYTLNIANQCRRAHRFTLHASDNTDWLRVVASDTGSVRPGRTEPFRATVTIDSTRLLPGAYDGRIFSRCTDCDQEPQCNQADLVWPIHLTVSRSVPPPTPIPTVTPRPTATLTPTETPTPETTEQPPFLVKELEEVTVTAGFDRPAPAPTPDVLAVLAWTNNVILNSQPTYSAPNLLPHFATPSQRSQSFRDARQRSVLEHSRGSNKTLGDVYSDWGEGAQAVNAYVKESGGAQARPDAGAPAADLSEAYRLTGRLAKAQAALDRASDADRRAPRYLNARGNLSLERARVALDRNEEAQAGEQLTRARADYQLVSQVARVGEGDAVIQSNVGETHLLGGALALRGGNAADAGAQFEESARLLGSARQSGRQYPFALTNLGRAFQGLGQTARLEGKEADARANFARAEEQYRQALGSHPDMAEAYFNLGDLAEDQGRRDEAKQNYGQAIRLRPEQPAPYYPLALLLQDEDPRRAAELAAIFLQLLPEEYKQGERAKNAERIRRGEKVPIPPRPGTGGGGRTSSVVPAVVGQTWADAVKTLEVAGFTAVRDAAGRNPKSSDLVVEQRPAAGATPPRGSTVNLRLEAPVKVPGLKDNSLEKARSKLAKEGLTLGRLTYEESCDKVGKVVGQSPRDGEKVVRGKAVNLTLGSVGERPVTLPDWVGRGRASAEAEIRNAGLKVGRVRTVEALGVTAGNVVRQEPAAGMQLAPGCKVKLDVAAEMVQVGSYAGLTADEAATQLSGVGLYALNQYRASQVPPGRVLDQSPSPGSFVRKGSFVFLYVSKPPGPPTVRIPSLRGIHRVDAEATLKQLGLKPNVVDESPPAGTAEDVDGGEVWDQTPKAGKDVPVGSPVTIKVKPVIIDG